MGFAGPAFYYNLQRAPQAPNRARLVVRTPTLADTPDMVRWIRHHVREDMPELDVTVGILGQGPPRAAPAAARAHIPQRQTQVSSRLTLTRLRRVPTHTTTQGNTTTLNQTAPQGAHTTRAR